MNARIVMRDSLEETLEYLRAERESIIAEAQRAGWLRLKISPLSSSQDFAAVRSAILPRRAEYVEGATPRTAFGQDVFSSTNVPPARSIFAHNENSYAVAFPGFLLFYCFTAPSEGGATPVIDVRSVFRDIDPGVVRDFRERGWMLERNYFGHLGRPWEEAFGTSRAEDVLRYCEENAIDAEFRDDGLQTRQVRPALLKHAASDRMSWFNHVVFWHDSRIDPEIRKVMLHETGGRLPFRTLYGDGEEIPADVVSHIAEIYTKHFNRERWEVGDLLLVDNIAAAHARDPYKGSRSIFVGMGEPLIRSGEDASPEPF
jgi:hypothetical protein